VKSRQIGLSYVDGYDSVRKAASRGGRDVWVMSRDEEQARQYIRNCKRWARILGLAAEARGENIFKKTGGKPDQTRVLAFASGQNIYALSSNPDAIAGKSGHVKLDEFALHRDQRTLYAVAKPVTQWGGTLSIISTHRGAHTVFNQILREIRERANPMGWSLHEIPIQRAVAEGLVERINRKSGRRETAEEWLARQRRECIDEEQWLQEYCCVPADEKTAFISHEMISACEEAGCPRDMAYLRQTEHPLFLGLDVARKRDLCVFDLGEEIGDVMWDRLRLELRDQSFADIQHELYRLLRLPGLRRACIDASGLGMQLAEEAKARFGWKVEPIIFTPRVKEELAFGLRRDFEERRLRIPRDDDLRADLRGLKKEASLGGNLRFAGESPDSHCDRTWAKALRQHAARIKTEVWAGVA
jgi:phage FluMu gp28-like protein